MLNKFSIFILSNLTLLLVTISCTNKPPHSDSNSNPISSTKLAPDSTSNDDISTAKPMTCTLGGFKIEYGYFEYDEEKFGFSNPGFIRVFKGGKLLFEDSFKGEGPVEIESLGYQNLAGKKLVFKLNHGTQACDYTAYSRYYVAFNDKIYFLKECEAITGGDHYASRFYEHILPKDSTGVKNALILVEGIIFHEQDQANLFDTSYIRFTDNKFTISKTTNNIEKAK